MECVELAPAVPSPQPSPIRWERGRIPSPRPHFSLSHRMGEGRGEGTAGASSTHSIRFARLENALALVANFVGNFVEMGQNPTKCPTKFATKFGNQGCYDKLYITL